MTFTQEWTVTIPTGKTQYQSSLIDNKIAELKSSGDIISENITVESERQKKITMVWKDEAAFNSYKAWLQTSGEYTKILNWRTSNNIEIV